MLDSTVGEATEPEAPRVAAPAATDFGDYVLETVIAHGGMGVVYRARQRSLNRTVAVKLLLLGRYSSAKSIERFRREAQSAAALRHPNIVAIHEVGEHDGQHFLSMDCVEGQSLAEKVRAGPLEARRVAEITRGIALAIQYAHEQGVLHRDIKPSNILLDARGQVRVTDFGLAKRLDDTSDLTVTGQMVGTPNYLSPEQAAAAHSEVGPASDVYSIGALLYELLTGRPPFMANSMQETLLRIRDAEPVSPRTLNPGLDREIETICLKCLEKEPRRRYVSAEALGQELERWLRGEPIQAKPCSPWMRLGKWVRRRPKVASLMFVSVLAILAFLVGQTLMTLRLNRANTRLQAGLYESRWRTADEAVRAGERDEAIAWLSYFLRQNPNDAGAAARLLSLLSSSDFPLLLYSLPHEATLTAMDLSRTGTRLATTAGKTARLWNVQSGRLEEEFAHPAQLTHGALGGDQDSRLLTISAEPKARLWDLNSRQIIKELDLGEIDERLIGRVVLRTRARHRMALNVHSNTVAILDAESGEWVGPPLTLSAGVYGLAFSEDGRFLATATDSLVQLWDAAKSQLLFAPQRWAGPPGSLRFSQDGHWLACLSGSQTWVMSTVTGAREREFKAVGQSIALVGHPDNLITGRRSPVVYNFRTGEEHGSPFGPNHARFDWVGDASLSALLFSTKTSDRWRLLEPSTGLPRLEPFFHDGAIVHRKLHPNGKLAITASQDRTARVWSVEMGHPEPITLPVDGLVLEARWSPSGQRILSTSTGGHRGEMRLWDARSGAALTPSLASGHVIYAAAWSPDGTRFATASQDFTARIWNGENGEAISPPLRHDNVVTHCAFSNDGKLLATAGDDRAVRLWDGHTGRPSGALVHSHSPLKVEFSKDGQRLLTASQDGTVRVWSVLERKLLVGPLHHEGICWTASFSPNERLLVSASSDGTARVWDAVTGQPALPPLRHEGSALWASFSPDGRAIVTSTESGIVRVWDTASGHLLSEPMRHANKVWLVKWTSDGRFLATSCNDGSARIWEAFTGHLVAEPFAHQPGNEVRRVAFSPDEHQLLTAAYDGSIKIWNLALLRPPLPVPGWLPELAEALAGKRIGAKDAPESVPGDSLQRVKHRLGQARGQDDYYARWARWMLEERLDRPVKPFRP